MIVVQRALLSTDTWVIKESAKPLIGVFMQPIMQPIMLCTVQHFASENKSLNFT